MASGITTFSSDTWSFLMAPNEEQNLELQCKLLVREVGRKSNYFGEFWSVWPDKSFGDQGWDAAFILRSGKESGYRVQVSANLKEIALVKFPAGGYLRSVPAPIQVGKPFLLSVQVTGNLFKVLVEDKVLFTFTDADPLPRGRFGFGGNSGSKIDFSEISFKKLAGGKIIPQSAHQPNFSSRKWLGGRQWIFDNDEPILLLPDPALSFINNVKLRPGVRPLLGFNSHWDVQNQGAYPEAKNDTEILVVKGTGASLQASWQGRHEKNRFKTSTTMIVGWNPSRATYTYDIASKLEVLPGQPFDFRYGFDFEHHTPLDPFNWKYLVFRSGNGKLCNRPVYPVDPGTQRDLATAQGLRVWHGRHNDPLPVSPAVEYLLEGTGDRKLNSAVCAAFYDTGVSYPAETLKNGSVVSVRYRYTGYPATEAAELFNLSKTYESPMLDPDHFYVFADWPRMDFSKYARMSEAWIYGQVPIMTGHNQRPAYQLAAKKGPGETNALKFGPMAYGAAPLPAPEGDLVKGRFALKVMAKGDNLHGPGARIELTGNDKGGKTVFSSMHSLGSGNFDWRQSGFVFELPPGVKTLTLGFGNGGTGDVYFSGVEFVSLKSGEPIPPGLAPGPAGPVSASPLPPNGAIADYRMIEGRGQFAYDFAAGNFGVLELANVGWHKEQGFPAIHFAENQNKSPSFPRAGKIENGYLSHPNYKEKKNVPAALAGFHGGEGKQFGALSLVTWIKPEKQMGLSGTNQAGDIIGIGARRIIVRLLGEKAPYKLEAAFNSKERVVSAETCIDPDKWHQVALTLEPDNQRKFIARLFVNGKQIQTGKIQADDFKLEFSPSIILGTELFYFHNSYYRGLIGRVLVFGRALGLDEIQKLVPIQD